MLPYEEIPEISYAARNLIDTISLHYKKYHNLNFKEFELAIKDSDKSFVDNFMEWVNIIRNQNNVYDKVMIKKLTKRYPYKSKRKRLIKKWWKHHSELIELNNVTITPNIKQ